MLANNADHLNVDESQLITSMDFGETQLMSCILGKESYAQLKVFQIYFPDLVVYKITTDPQEMFYSILARY